MTDPIDITIIIPHRMGEDCSVTLQSLEGQTYQGFRTLCIGDEGKGANWARNEGFRLAFTAESAEPTEFVLFSDNDISWKSHALENLRHALKLTKASYSYGRYRIGDSIWCHDPWNPELLKNRNYISTMTLIRAADFPGFDESIQRFQDWDLWLTMLEQGKRGVYCNDLIFTTELRPGISHGNPLGAKEAREIVLKKHGLPIEP